MKEEHRHPKLPYTHNMNKVCKIEDCNNLGWVVKCGFCGKPKRKVLCEKHLLEHKEKNRLLRGKLSTASSLRYINAMEERKKNRPQNNSPINVSTNFNDLLS